MTRKRGNIFFKMRRLGWDLNDSDHLQEMVQKLLVFRVVS